MARICRLLSFINSFVDYRKYAYFYSLIPQKLTQIVYPPALSNLQALGARYGLLRLCEVARMSPQTPAGNQSPNQSANPANSIFNPEQQLQQELYKQKIIKFSKQVKA
ncbi:hypothetical protein AJ80_08440 [Polytolypa hystricis UAMH7299]|uniref:Uncharacterized protein n=1 Tax=Polytolypa hystricis (strain UAMH7299) TaxID=1447883 RepID=A0A2B7X7Z1_POLH7|nr:hypothetical protein AJ80_08440 [Polytolypa hystricis UAMH7299]